MDVELVEVRDFLAQHPPFDALPAEVLDDLVGLDTVKAISDFSQQQMTLQAAQMSFKTMSGLSLFNYL